MYVKKLPRELTNTTANDPCIPTNGNFFIWTSTDMIFLQDPIMRIEYEDKENIKRK
jgi:hypothetical protein